ncbi:YggS family pyridoxal phosphate-dependent enzyme [Pseudarthrobacter sp. PS3-L1]|uniref:YggS family pyridoxal phosphate-dependent enzyme n=1 Tax=Pseudarthrobacter sp. PS3-L1 TaxID=3046207 RepID=UPI0024BA93B5|nr:YggS family pyridoxal phosphate-dependent enzyme [Pseudarthrobacter sp. PS3-L1]MDJ0320381.1 YggS family pyridoxal phosphate-dependent enzyme [Pseudarthrobacter sp. PS3-L1]
MTEPGVTPAPAADRNAVLAQNLAAVQARIASAVDAAGRAETPPMLIVVSKFHPAADVQALARLGITNFGENRDQEAAAKAAEVGDLGLRWHFVGQLQTNKAKSVARYAASVHSVDRSALAAALGRAVDHEHDATGRGPLEIFIQVTLDDDASTSRGGADPADVPALADAIAERGLLRLAGVMAVAPLGANPDRAFEKLAGISARLRSDHPSAAAISAGMSQDLEAAIRHGATHLRIGSDILGSRPAVG